MEKTIKEKFRGNLKAIIAKTGFSGRHFSVLAACSGGADSLAMLFLLNGLREELGFTLSAAYVDHKLRIESGDEAKFVDKICHELGIPFFLGEFDDNFWQNEKNNTEERARMKRYELLFDLVKRNNFSILATAHHLDDQVETLLMRILDRGTGVKGLCGIKPINSNSDILSNSQNGTFFVVRPMLNIAKKEISAFMQERQFLSDTSNFDTKYRRNYFRHKVIPALDALLPDVPYKQNIARLAENAETESAVMRELMDDFWQKMVTKIVTPTIYIPRTEIKSHTYGFWLTAFSYLFSSKIFGTRQDLRSPSAKTLNDITDFILKTDPGTANYNPFIMERTRDGVRITLGCRDAIL